MSENIKITVVIDDEKLNTRSEQKCGKTVIVTHDSSMTVMSTLLKNNLISGSFCGGRGDCGRCKIQFLTGAVTPTPLERSVLEPDELRQGYRLACLSKPKDDCVIKLAFPDAPQIGILADMIDVTENDDYIGQRTGQAGKSKADVMESMQPNSAKALKDTQDMDRESKAEAIVAVDLGTTTIAMQLMELSTGRILDTYCEMNPQRRYGADVLSRIKASCEGHREALRQSVMAALERGAARFMERSAEVKCMCIAGNTAMEHLLMGYDVASLGASPFTPMESGLQEYHHPAWDFPVWVVPVISAFVGGDIVAGLYALDLLPAAFAQAGANGRPEGTASLVGHGGSKEGAGDFPALLIDLGTNGEMAVTDGARMIVTATAAGPAFEGGAGAGIVGSDMIACTAALLRKGILDETGLLKEPYFTDGVSVGTPALRLRNRDIRDLQMAKAAVRAGVELLCRRLGAATIERVYLAGGFGYELDVEAAFLIGLLPEHMRGRVQAVGNTSLAGAYRIGRGLWLHKLDGYGLQERLSSIESMNLAHQADFEKLYIQYMSFQQA